MATLIKHHAGVEARCEDAYKNAKMSGEALKEAVKEHCNKVMELHAVTEANKELGFASSTYSFNLPAKTADLKVN